MRPRSVATSAIGPLQGVRAHLAGADPHHPIDLGHPQLPVADLAGASRSGDRVDDLVHAVVVHDDLDANLGHEVHLVLSAAIDLGVPSLAPEAFDVGGGEPAHADLAESLFHRLDPVWLDHRRDQLHGAVADPAAPTVCSNTKNTQRTSIPTSRHERAGTAAFRR